MSDITRNRTSTIIDWLIMAALFTLFLAAAFTSRWQHSISGQVNWHTWLDGFLQNSGTEMLGAFLTFGLIEILRGRRKDQETEAEEERRAEEIKKYVDDALTRYQEQLDEQERKALINQLSSPVPGLPAEAVRLLRHKGWLEDKDIAEGLQVGGDFYRADLRGVVLANIKFKHGIKLEQVDLYKANLEGADMGYAKLEGASLIRASLVGTSLWASNLEDANLIGACMINVDLFEANLKGAYLTSVNLRDANLCATDLENVYMQTANLEGVEGLTIDQLKQARSLFGTILPDGTKLINSWQESFEEWCEEVEVDEDGCIVPAKLDDEDA